MDNSNLHKPNMNKPPRRNLPQRPRRKQPNNNWLFWIVLGFIFLILLSQSNQVSTINAPKEMSYSEFYSVLKTNDQSKQIQRLELVESTDNTLKGVMADGTEFSLHIPKEDEHLLQVIREKVPDFKVVPP